VSRDLLREDDRFDGDRDHRDRHSLLPAAHRPVAPRRIVGLDLIWQERLATPRVTESLSKRIAIVF
jgi:hypothetical protein